MRYRRTYEALKRLGFSPTKAAEVVLDASRGDRHAMAFVEIAYIGRRA